ncbi:MAG: chorismate mutase, partial [Planctomycetes bacterium]|nr:chorismate mutase [Planctomycetota bacterium]
MSLEELRNNIDKIDCELIKLLNERAQFVIEI